MVGGAPVCNTDAASSRSASHQKILALLTRPLLAISSCIRLHSCILVCAPLNKCN